MFNRKKVSTLKTRPWSMVSDKDPRGSLAVFLSAGTTASPCVTGAPSPIWYTGLAAPYMMLDSTLKQSGTRVRECCAPDICCDCTVQANAISEPIVDQFLGS